jgi:hypothetical protein
MLSENTPKVSRFCITPDQTQDITSLADELVTAWLEQAGAPGEVAALIETTKYLHGLLMAGAEFWEGLPGQQRNLELADCMARLWEYSALLMAHLVPIGEIDQALQAHTYAHAN